MQVLSSSPHLLYQAAHEGRALLLGGCPPFLLLVGVSPPSVSFKPSPTPLPPPLLLVHPLPLPPRVCWACCMGAGAWRLVGPPPRGELTMLENIERACSSETNT